MGRRSSKTSKTEVPITLPALKTRLNRNRSLCCAIEAETMEQVEIQDCQQCQISLSNEFNPGVILRCDHISCGPCFVKNKGKCIHCIKMKVPELQKQRRSERITDNRSSAVFPPDGPSVAQINVEGTESSLLHLNEECCITTAQETVSNQNCQNNDSYQKQEIFLINDGKEINETEVPVNQLIFVDQNSENPAQESVADCSDWELRQEAAGAMAKLKESRTPKQGTRRNGNKSKNSAKKPDLNETKQVNSEMAEKPDSASPTNQMIRYPKSSDNDFNGQSFVSSSEGLPLPPDDVQRPTHYYVHLNLNANLELVFAVDSSSLTIKDAVNNQSLNSSEQNKTFELKCTFTTTTTELNEGEGHLSDQTFPKSVSNDISVLQDEASVPPNDLSSQSTENLSLERTEKGIDIPVIKVEEAEVYPELPLPTRKREKETEADIQPSKKLCTCQILKIHQTAQTSLLLSEECLVDTKKEDETEIDSSADSSSMEPIENIPFISRKLLDAEPHPVLTLVKAESVDEEGTTELKDENKKPNELNTTNTEVNPASKSVRVEPVDVHEEGDEQEHEVINTTITDVNPASTSVRVEFVDVDEERKTEIEKEKQQEISNSTNTEINISEEKTLTSITAKSGVDKRRRIKLKEKFRFRSQRSSVVIYDYITVIECETTLYKCNLCNARPFKTKAQIKYHKFCNKAEEKPFQCSHNKKDGVKCEERFVVRSHLEYHERTHTGERPHKCQICPGTFNQRGKLTRHLRTHTGDKPYPCNVCFKRFGSAQALKTHALIHTGERPYECQICQKTFQSQTGLKRHHTLVHTGKRPHKCLVCQKAFALKHTLYMHLRTHYNERERPFKCTHPGCKRDFHIKKDLVRHLSVHSGIKPYKCWVGVCTERFRRRDNLMRHARNIHKSSKEEARKLAVETVDQP